MKVKVDTDRHIGHERDVVRVEGEPIGHVMTSEYGSKMLSLGGVEHLTGGSKKEGRVTCDALLKLCNREAVRMVIGEEAHATEVIVEAGKAPIINGERENLMRVGCGSATIGMFPKQWIGYVDDVVVVMITLLAFSPSTKRAIGCASTGIRSGGVDRPLGAIFRSQNPGLGGAEPILKTHSKFLAPLIPKWLGKACACSWSPQRVSNLPIMN